MQVYCGCKKCGGTADKCFGDMYPGADFKPIKSPQDATGFGVDSTTLLAAELVKAKELITDWQRWYNKHQNSMPDGGLKIKYASIDLLRLWDKDKIGI